MLASHEVFLVQSAVILLEKQVCLLQLVNSAPKVTYSRMRVSRRYLYLDKGRSMQAKVSHGEEEEGRMRDYSNA